MKGASVFTKKSPTADLDIVAANLCVSLTDLSSESPEFDTVLTRLERVHALKTSSSHRVSPDTLAMVLGNLAGIVTIVNYERAHVVTSKALSFILKPR